MHPSDRDTDPEAGGDGWSPPPAGDDRGRWVPGTTPAQAGRWVWLPERGSTQRPRTIPPLRNRALTIPPDSSSMTRPPHRGQTNIRPLSSHRRRPGGTSRGCRRSRRDRSTREEMRGVARAPVAGSHRVLRRFPRRERRSAPNGIPPRAPCRRGQHRAVPAATARPSGYPADGFRPSGFPAGGYPAGGGDAPTAAYPRGSASGGSARSPRFEFPARSAGSHLPPYSEPLAGPRAGCGRRRRRSGPTVRAGTTGSRPPGQGAPGQGATGQGHQVRAHQVRAPLRAPAPRRTGPHRLVPAAHPLRAPHRQAATTARRRRPPRAAPARAS